MTTLPLSPPECDFCGGRMIGRRREYCADCIQRGSPGKYWENVINDQAYTPEYRARAVRELAAFKEKYRQGD